jgi:lambda family phage portal protein
MSNMADISATPAWASEFFGVPSAPLAPRAQYDAGGGGRRMKGWNPPNSGPNRAIKGLPKIRDRSRDAVRNDWTGAAGVQRWKTNLIGTGIQPRFRAITNHAKRRRYQQLWANWCKQSDADGILNFYGQQALATGSWLESGEVFCRLRYRRANAGMAVPLQLQLIEADFVPMLDADSYSGLPKGNRIRSGIELNNSGQRVAYWVYKEHPADGVSTVVDMSQLIRVPADQMLHIFEPKRPGQLRGVPDFAPVLARLRNVADFDDAVLERQKLANLFTLFIKKQMPSGDAIDPLTGMPIKTNADGEPLAPLAPGLIQELMPGEEMQFANPPEAGTTYGEYMRQQNMGTAAGQHLPYEVLSGDIKEVSDRTLRVIINEFRRYAEQRQWHIIIPMLCQRVMDAWVDLAVLAGEIARGDSEDCKAVEWAPQGWAYIHPVQDATGKKIEIEAGIRSRDSVIAERGDDPEVVDDERAAGKAREDRLGLTIVPPAAPNGATTPAKPGAKKAASEDDNVAPNEYPRNAGVELIKALTDNLPTILALFSTKEPSATQQAMDVATLALRQQIVDALTPPSHEPATE